MFHEIVGVLSLSSLILSMINFIVLADPYRCSRASLTNPTQIWWVQNDYCNQSNDFFFFVSDSYK